MTRGRIMVIAGAVCATILTPHHNARAYVTAGDQWPDGSVVMQMQLRSLNGTLADGSTSWGAPAEAALAMWNVYLDRVQFRVVRDSTASISGGNGLNNVFWGSTAYGKDFDSFASSTQSSVAALTLSWSSGSRRTESDVIFRNTLSWNSYRGARTGSAIDIRRIALHEFGHVLGLKHPNDNGQSVTAIMNSVVNVEALQADDISGVQALYSTGGNGTVAFPPRNESLDFRSQLETKYRTQLQRDTIATYVDNEGDIVWTSEYFRYRVNQCSHDSALARVMSEIDTGATLGVCGSAAAGQVNFPPRNEALAFRIQLETKYRDGLRRGPNLTAVDNEGDVVWTQEYLRYRVNGCSHGDAVQRVFLQIDGRGIQPVCR